MSAFSRHPIHRRAALASVAAAPFVMTAPPATDIRVEQVTHSFEDFTYRAPYMFGGSLVDRVTLLNVTCTVVSRTGRRAHGFGSMPLGNVWAFPSRKLTYNETLNAMKALSVQIERITGAHSEYGHPIDVNLALEPAYLRAARDVTAELRLPEPIPKLCTLVTASPFDAAIHDAFGKLHGRNCYLTYGPDLLPYDLGHYLGSDYKNLKLDRFLTSNPKPSLPLFHSVGASDPLTAAEVDRPFHDGLPQVLGDWIRHDGLDHFKIKLNGDNLEADIGRVLTIDRVTVEAQAERGVNRWFYSLDFNEKCRTVDYLLAFIAKVKEGRPQAFSRILYIEQPTARDLNADRQNNMSRAAKLAPVVIDESLTGLDALLLARDMGYTGAALKACKGQSQAMLMAAAAQKLGMFLCVQDLTCPGASLVHSAGIAAHVPGVAGIEANSRQYVPDANRGWDRRFPGLFRVTDGSLKTRNLTGLGLGAVA